MYTWLCQIGKNAWIKECRRNKRYADIDRDELTAPTIGLSLEEQVITRDEFRRVHKAILKLEDPYRDVFVLHAIGEVKLKEIACIYGKSESWAKVTYFRAKQQIIQEVRK